MDFLCVRTRKLQISSLCVYPQNPNSRADLFCVRTRKLQISTMCIYAHNPNSSVIFFFCVRTRKLQISSPKVLVIPRKRWLRPNMTEKLFTGTLRINQPTNQISCCSYMCTILLVARFFCARTWNPNLAIVRRYMRTIVIIVYCFLCRKVGTPHLAIVRIYANIQNGSMDFFCVRTQKLQNRKCACMRGVFRCVRVLKTSGI